MPQSEALTSLQCGAQKPYWQVYCCLAGIRFLSSSPPPPPPQLQSDHKCPIAHMTLLNKECAGVRRHGQHRTNAVHDKQTYFQQESEPRLVYYLESVNEFKQAVNVIALPSSHDPASMEGNNPVKLLAMNFALTLYFQCMINVIPVLTLLASLK